MFRLPRVLLSNEIAGIGSLKGDPVAPFTLSARSEALKALADFDADRALQAAAAILRKSVPTRLMDLQPGQPVSFFRRQGQAGLRRKAGQDSGKKGSMRPGYLVRSFVIARARLKATTAGSRTEAA